MRRPWHVWLISGICLAVVLAGWSWVSLNVLRLESEAAAERRLAAREDDIRLALWQMDSHLSAFIAQENARPYFEYRVFYPARDSFARAFEPTLPEETVLASSLVNWRPPYVLLHFQFNPDGTIESPQNPQQVPPQIATQVESLKPLRQEAGNRLTQLRRMTDRNDLLSKLQGPLQIPEREGRYHIPQSTPSFGPLDIESQASLRNRKDYTARRRTHEQMQREATNVAAFAPVGIAPEIVRPLWLGEELFLVRRVTVKDKVYVQGCWLDWPQLRNDLKAGLQDIITQAELFPLQRRPDPGKELLLTAIPVRLDPGPIPALADEGWTPIKISLAVAWVGVLVALCAAVGLLQGVVALSERRAAFVSAVTHELRTPLTTFRLYAEMLSQGMITSEESRAHYLATLRREADRLSHLVENVLAYARLERNQKLNKPAKLVVSDLVSRIRERLEERAAQAGMRLEVTQTGDASVIAHATSVEQILFNLVDNACKYACRPDASVHLEITTHGGELRMCVRDEGPGISRKDARKLFRPFSKTALEAAHSAPGVGLGLALSLRMARDMGGDLRLSPSNAHGAAFELRLQVA